MTALSSAVGAGPVIHHDWRSAIIISHLHLLPISFKAAVSSYVDVGVGPPVTKTLRFHFVLDSLSVLDLVLVSLSVFDSVLVSLSVLDSLLVSLSLSVYLSFHFQFKIHFQC